MFASNLWLPHSRRPQNQTNQVRRAPHAHYGIYKRKALLLKEEDHDELVSTQIVSFFTQYPLSGLGLQMAVQSLLFCITCPDYV